MLKYLTLRNFTVFNEGKCDFGSGLNLIVGENATGKSHLMKIAYSAAAASAQAKQEEKTTKSAFLSLLQLKLMDVFRAEKIENLVSGKRPGFELEVSVGFDTPGVSEFCFHCSYPTEKKTKSVELGIVKMPNYFLQHSPVFIPTREIISIVPAFSRFYDDKGLLFDGTFFDLAMLLQALPFNSNFNALEKDIIGSLEEVMNGKVQWANGRFYLREYVGNKEKERLLEMPLVAEGIRKIAMLSYLVTNGSINKDSILFWDEPEANLNPCLLQVVADVLINLAAAGTQIIVATHSLFLLREIHILLTNRKEKGRFFALEKMDGEIKIHAADSIEEMEPIAALDADLEQSDRYMELSGETE